MHFSQELQDDFVNSDDSHHGAQAFFGQYYTENEEPEIRGHQWSGYLACLTSALLRGGFLLQFAVLSAGFILYNLHGGFGIFTFDLFSTPEHLRNDSVYTGLMIILESIYLLGSLSIAGFQTFLSDNSKSTRGFRAGSKMLSTAATIDIFVGALRLMQYLYAFNFLRQRWYMKYLQSSTDWCLFHSSAFLHSIVLILYGLGIFYMESYHEKGVQHDTALTVLSLFTLTSLFEFLLVFTRFGSLTSLFHLAALAAATCWAGRFESIIQNEAPGFHDTTLDFVSPEQQDIIIPQHKL